MEYPAVEVRIQGIVQGVGFRPFVYRLAERFALTGSNTNTGTGVLIRSVLTIDNDYFRFVSLHPDHDSAYR